MSPLCDSPNLFLQLLMLVIGRQKISTIALYHVQELQSGKACGAILCLHRDGHGNIWSGHASGGVGVWSEARRALCCPIMRACKGDVRVIASDGCGHAYVGGASGNVKALRLRYTGAASSCTLEHACTLLLRVRACVQCLSLSDSQCLPETCSTCLTAEVVTFA